MQTKQIYMINEGNQSLKHILGNKGAILAEMQALGMPVPFCFTISAKECNRYLKTKILSPELVENITNSIKKIEKHTSKKFGARNNFLILSVRSGASISMPGMMDTVLNIGFNDLNTVLNTAFPNNRFLLDSYRRLIMMFSTIVKAIASHKFEEAIKEEKAKNKIETDQELTEQNLLNIIKKFKQIYFENTNEEFPQNPITQVLQTIEAVFKSWNNPRAKIYRQINNIEPNIGTAVTVQEMVFGNLNQNSGTGVAFSRNPINGNNNIFGEYLINAQGEDIVSGARTPFEIETLKQKHPHLYNQMKTTLKTLENKFCHMQEIEFTIENGKLFILQSRNGKCTANAMVKICSDMLAQGKITKQDVKERITPQILQKQSQTTFDPQQQSTALVLAQGLAACSGCVSGAIALTQEKAIEFNKNNIPAILVRQETSPEDLEGMVASQGFLTVYGGLTSHAAVVARSMEKTCIVGCSSLSISNQNKTISFEIKTLKEGDYISLDGESGKVYEGILAITKKQLPNNLQEIVNEN